MGKLTCKTYVVSKLDNLQQLPHRSLIFYCDGKRFANVFENMQLCKLVNKCKKIIYLVLLVESIFKWQLIKLQFIPPHLAIST